MALIFHTRTVSGAFGKSYDLSAAGLAVNGQEAVDIAVMRAQADGYEVLDVVGDVLVIGEES